MARSPKGFRRYSWDSCSWIATINDEKIKTDGGAIESRGALCRAVLDAAAKGGSEICTSALSLVEVSKHPAPNPKEGTDKIKTFFENDYIVVVPLDRRVGEFARELMQRGYAGLKPPDAAHLASAAIVNADEMHTFDARLLALDEKIEKADGTRLKICKPSMGGPPLPLLDQPQIKGESDAEDTNQEGAEVRPNETKPDTPVRGRGEGTGMPGGRSDIRPGAKADRDGETIDQRTPEEKADAEALTRIAAAFLAANQPKAAEEDLNEPEAPASVPQPVTEKPEGAGATPAASAVGGHSSAEEHRSDPNAASRQG